MQEQKLLFFNYTTQTTGTTYTYGKILDQFHGRGAINAAASNTVNAVAPAAGSPYTGPFDDFAVGDLIWVYKPEGPGLGGVSGETVDKRRVTAVNSIGQTGQIVVDGAVVTWTNLTSWYHLPFRSGTTVNDGWVNVNKYKLRMVRIDLTTVAANGGIDLSLEVKGYTPDSGPTQIFFKNYAAGVVFPNNADEFNMPEYTASLRVGLSAHTALAGTDVVTVAVLGDIEPGAA
jgi:hypothetical protein